jgi:hypothetical protein
MNQAEAGMILIFMIRPSRLRRCRGFPRRPPRDGADRR